MLRKRTIIKQYEDLLPDILIEAQQCDGVTALAALRRTIEGLATEYDFFVETNCVTVSVVEDVDWVKIPIDERNLLQILSVEYIVDGDEANPRPVEWKVVSHDMLFVRNVSGGENEEVSFKITASYMPDFDAEIKHRDLVTKWRSLIVAKTLEDLFSMEGQPWANASRFQIYAIRSAKFLEDFIYTERISKHDSRSQSASLPSSRNIFC